MKRFHVHVGVADLGQSVAFYTGLFGAEPAVHRNDYAKWMLDDPRINFAVSQREGAASILACRQKQRTNWIRATGV